MRHFKVHAIRHGESAPTVGQTFSKTDCLIPVQTAAGATKFKLLFADKNGKVVQLDIPEVDLSNKLDKGGYSGTAQDLKTAIDNINTILQSNDEDLDELQEIVNYIKQNKQILSTLAISNIAGLQDALNNKVDKVPGKGLSQEDFTTALKNKLEGLSNTDISGLAKKDGTNLTNISNWQSTLGIVETASGDGF